MSQIEFTDSYLTDDALDRRAALGLAVDVFGDEVIPRVNAANSILHMADAFYEWLRKRNSLTITLSIQAGQPQDASE